MRTTDGRLIEPVAVLVLLAIGLIACGKKSGAIPDPNIARFIAGRRAHATELAQAQTSSVPNSVWNFFDAVEHDDWDRATNLFTQLQKESARFPQQTLKPKLLQVVVEKLGFSTTPAAALQTALWAPISETIGTYEQFHDWDRKWLRRFAQDVIGAIPSNSVYFGGTDPGRFLISAYSESYRDGRPFFTITQNQLADGTYLDYVRGMYGHRLHIPTAQDSQTAFQEYLTDAQKRLQANQLKAGEDVRLVQNRVQVSGQVAVMEINGLLARMLVDKNPDRDVYVEESFPLEWMYPYLEPHGLIMKLNREPLRELSEETIKRDGDYWNKYVGELLGDWLSAETPVSEVCEFCRTIYLRKDLAGFRGDVAFARNAEAQKTFSKLRSSIGGVYAWRAEHGSFTERQRMSLEADFAFKQALALCPYSPEAVYRYVNLLLSQRRVVDARLIAETLVALAPQDNNAKDLLERIAQQEGRSAK